MNILMFFGLLIPLLGTALGAVLVLFSKRGMSDKVQCYLNEFAGGVMMAASIWSLLLPAIEQADDFGRFAFLPAEIGFWLGVFFLAYLQKRLPCESVEIGGEFSGIKPDNAISGAVISKTEHGTEKSNKLRLLLLAIVIHNIPEGMAVGAVFDVGNSTLMSAFILSIGIAVQNIPEGAIISLPLYANGMKKKRACLYGILSGVVEPAAGMITVILSGAVLPIMPYLLGFSAGAMIYVVVEELVPCTEEKGRFQKGTFLFAVGFSLMMILDVALG